MAAYAAADAAAVVALQPAVAAAGSCLEPGSTGVEQAPPAPPLASSAGTGCRCPDGAQKLLVELATAAPVEVAGQAAETRMVVGLAGRRK